MGRSNHTKKTISKLFSSSNNNPETYIGLVKSRLKKTDTIKNVHSNDCPPWIRKFYAEDMGYTCRSIYDRYCPMHV